MFMNHKSEHVVILQQNGENPTYRHLVVLRNDW